MGRLHGEIEHHPYADIADHVRTHRPLHDALGRRGGGGGSPRRLGRVWSARTMLGLPAQLHPQGRLLLGEAGLIVSVLGAYYTFLKLAKLRERSLSAARARMRVLHVDSAATWRGGQNQVLLTALGMARLRPRRRRSSVGRAALSRRAPGRPGSTSSPSPLAATSRPRAAGPLAPRPSTRPDVVHAHDPARPGGGRGGRSLEPADRCSSRAARRLPPAGRRSRAGSTAAPSGSSRSSRAILRDPPAHDGLAARAPAPRLRGRRDAPAAARRSGAAGGRSACPRRRSSSATSPRSPTTRTTPRSSTRRPRSWRASPRRASSSSARVSCRRPSRNESAPAASRTASSWPASATDVDALLPACRRLLPLVALEGLGTSLLDAMLFGRAVVATAAGGIPEVVEDGVTGRLVPARSPERLAEALVTSCATMSGAPRTDVRDGGGSRSASAPSGW